MEKEIEIFKVYKDTRIFAKDGHLCRGALWEVSNLGRVRKNGDAFIPFKNGSGYLVFGHYFVHRAVAELFLEENIYQKPTVDHKNRCILDNRACNLRWATWSEQNKNRDNDSIINVLRKINIGNKYALGNKNALGCRHPHTEESKAKMSAARIGKVWVTNPTTEKSTMVNPSELNYYLANGYVRGMKKSEEYRAKKRAATLGNKNTLGKVWVTNPTTSQSNMIAPSELPEFLDKGYIRGRKIKK